MFQRLVARIMGKAGDDDKIPLFGVMSSGAVDLHQAGAPGGGDHIGLKPFSVGDVPNVDLFMFEQFRRLHQLGVQRAAPLVMKVGTGHAGPMDLRFEQSCQHGAGIFQGVEFGKPVC